MKALVSMQDGLAFVPGSHPRLLSLDREPQAVETDDQGFRMFGSPPDAVWLDAVDETALLQAIKNGWRLDRAGRLVDLLLNPKTSDRIIRMSASALEPLLESVAKDGGADQPLKIFMDVESDFVRAWKATWVLPHSARLIAFVQRDFTRQLAEADSKSRSTRPVPLTVISQGKVVALNEVTRTGIVRASDGERVFSLGDQSTDGLAVGQAVTFYVSSEFKACVALGVTSAAKAGRVMSRSRAVALAKMNVLVKKDLAFGRVEINRLEAGRSHGLSVSKH